MSVPISPALCPHCGYNLRGSINRRAQDLGLITCPECGHRDRPTALFLTRRPWSALAVFFLPHLLAIATTRLLIAWWGMPVTIGAWLFLALCSIPCGVQATLLAIRPKTELGVVRAWLAGALAGLGTLILTCMLIV